MTPSESATLVTEIKMGLHQAGAQKAQVIICPPFTSLDTVLREIQDEEGVDCGAQNCHWELDGAYTGEVSAKMLGNMGVEYVILGHSERRKYQFEDDLVVEMKIKKALSQGLKIIYCCGESEEERQIGDQFEVVEMQVETALFNFSADDMKNIIIAYEPVWAIGTGKTASPEQAQEMHSFIRGMISEQYGDDVADNMSILYGGSCKPSNAKELFSQDDIDGGLIGGASLVANDFVEIIKSF